MNESQFSRRGLIGRVAGVFGWLFVGISGASPASANPETLRGRGPSWSGLGEQDADQVVITYTYDSKGRLIQVPTQSKKPLGTLRYTYSV